MTDPSKITSFWLTENNRWNWSLINIKSKTKKVVKYFIFESIINDDDEDDLEYELFHK